MSFIARHFYVLMLLAGAVACLAISVFRRKKYEYSLKQALGFTGVCAISGYIFSRLLFILETGVFAFTITGLSFYGLVLLMPIVMFFVSVISKESYFKCMDFLSVFVPISLAFVKIGCHYAGCCGILTHYLNKGIFSVISIQLLECILNVLIVTVLCVIERKIKIRGILYPIYMGTYAVIRFILEFFKEKDYIVWSLSNAQWLSVLCLIVALMILYIILKSRKTEKQ